MCLNHVQHMIFSIVDLLKNNTGKAFILCFAISVLMYIQSKGTNHIHEMKEVKNSST